MITILYILRKTNQIRCGNQKLHVRHFKNRNQIPIKLALFMHWSLKGRVKKSACFQCQGCLPMKQVIDSPNKRPDKSIPEFCPSPKRIVQFPWRRESSAVDP